MALVKQLLRISGVWVLLALVGGGAFWFVFSRGPDLNFDLLNYHYFTGYAALSDRWSLDIAPAWLMTFLNPYWNVVSYLANSTLEFPWNAWVLLSIQLLSLPVLAGILLQIERAFGRDGPALEGLLALSICLVSPLWWSELGASFFSSSTAFLILLALWLGLGTVDDAHSRRPLIRWVLAGGLAGLATGLKLTNAIFAIAVPCVLMPLLWRGGHRSLVRNWLAFSIGGVAGIGVTAFWNYYLWREWDSPLYPFYNAIFGSPYFDSVNWRDMRWQFLSLDDLCSFMAAAWRPTQKTSELFFADGRLTVALLLGVSGLTVGIARLLRWQKASDNAKGSLVPSGLIWFASVAFALWAALFAYQRYAIPLELIWGFVIWILVRHLFQPRAVTPILLLVLVFSVWRIAVPDWGHQGQARGTGEARFGLQLPPSLVQSPAIYLIARGPNSYVLPFLHGDSRFLTADYAPLRGLDERIRVAIAESAGLPVRMLGFEEDVAKLPALAARFGLPNPDQAPWTCLRFGSLAHRFVSCEIAAGLSAPARLELESTIVIDLRGNTPLPPEVLWISGLSHPEPGGRWSDADEVVITFSRCLPSGSVDLRVQGRAYGPNIGRPVLATVGDQRAEFTLDAASSSANAVLYVGPACRREIRLRVPAKTSPASLGDGPDTREIGIGITTVRIARGQ